MNGDTSSKTPDTDLANLSPPPTQWSRFVKFAKICVALIAPFSWPAILQCKFIGNLAL